MSDILSVVQSVLGFSRGSPPNIDYYSD
jgi:hypothetical protein